MDTQQIGLILSADVVSCDQKKLCSLWAGYGYINALTITFRDESKPIVKLIFKVVQAPHDSGEAHERKVSSYVVEAAFYEACVPRLVKIGVDIATPLHVTKDIAGNISLLMTDLREQFPINTDSMLCRGRTKAALDWLAKFHAAFWQQPAAEEYGLWKEGCYWRLDTRMSEFA